MRYEDWHEGWHGASAFRVKKQRRDNKRLHTHTRKSKRKHQPNTNTIHQRPSTMDLHRSATLLHHESHSTHKRNGKPVLPQQLFQSTTTNIATGGQSKTLRTLTRIRIHKIH